MCLNEGLENPSRLSAQPEVTFNGIHSNALCLQLVWVFLGAGDFHQGKNSTEKEGEEIKLLGP